MLIPFNVQVTHGRKLVATVRVAATDKRSAVIMAEQNARAFHSIPPQVQLIGIINGGK